jgi:hypothetical protein
MGTHLARCHGAGDALHLVITGGGNTWWMHLAARPTTTLRDLDHHLRATWLECCGHLSSFTINGVPYEEIDPDADFSWYSAAPRSVAARLTKVLAVGSTFDYVYDFGSSTELDGRVRGTIAAGKRKITLLAQNAPIAWACAACGGPATRACGCCQALRCAPCCDQGQRCDCFDDADEGWLPVVNSPRVGVCGYEGPHAG